MDLSLVYEQQLDYAVFSGGWEIGRIFQETDSLPEHKWSWAILMNGPIGKRYDCVGSLEEAEEQLRGAPSFYRDRDYEWNDRRRETELHDYYRAPYYWGI